MTSPELHIQLWMDVKQEKRIDDYWNVDGSRDLSGSWTGFTQLTPLEEKPPNEDTRSRWRLTRKQLAYRPDHLWPESGHVKNQNSIMPENYEALFYRT